MLSQLTQSVICKFTKVYENAHKNHPESCGARIYRSLNKCFYGDVGGVDITNGVDLVNTAYYLLKIGDITQDQYENVLFDVEQLTGYNEIEIEEQATKIRSNLA